ncbi:MAG TPA: NAD(P)H-dependent oxidoreductase [Burkholderiales bacterium]|nr:NAD(P)H-dependent oxidoreductase [Burkholderiales bacterium]
MQTILHLNTSLYGGEGQSSRLAAEFVARSPSARVITRDLARDPVPHLDAFRFGAFLAKPEARTAGQSAVVAYSDALIDELRRADTLVLGLPMYNFGIPSQLKAYFDHVARAGVTFRYTEKGAVGLLTGKRAYVFAARGGLYAGSPRDTQTAYVRDFLAFIGVSDVQFVYAEGLALGAESMARSLAGARRTLQSMILSSARAA